MSAQDIPRYGYSVFWSAEDDAYIATCPEFPRLSGFGDTEADALESVKEVVREAVATCQEEGWPLPEPTGLDRFSGKFQVRLSRAQHAALARRAESEGMSMNALVANFISSGLASVQASDAAAALVENRLEALFDHIERQFSATRQTRSGVSRPARPASTARKP